MLLRRFCIIICRIPISVSDIEDQGSEFSSLNISVRCRLKFIETELLVLFNLFIFLLLWLYIFVQYIVAFSLAVLLNIFNKFFST
jgi:hypothetical protein